MIRMLRADFVRLKNSFAFRLFLAGMIAVTAFLMIMQATGMDYTVPLSRVIFLPLSMYGIGLSAFVSVFVGTDFSDGFIRNKLLAAEDRRDFVISQMIICSIAGIAVYVVIIAISAGVGQFFFENNVTGPLFLQYFMLGIAMCLATSCLFTVITLLCADKTKAAIWCMGFAFIMLFLCLHTNSILVQNEYKDGILNPKYIGGVRRTIYSLVHDLNPCGQAAQLSAWEVWHPIRVLLIDLLMMVCLPVLGCMLFEKKDIN